MNVKRLADLYAETKSCAVTCRTTSEGGTFAPAFFERVADHLEALEKAMRPADEKGGK